MENIITGILGVLFVGFILLLGASFVFMYIWNNIIVLAISITNPIDYIQAVWLTIFCFAFLKSDSVNTGKG